MPAIDDVVWLSYSELASRLDITAESCRNLVRRRRWERRDGNDGCRRIGVPRDYLEGRDDPPIGGAVDAGTDSPTDTPMNPPADGGMALAIAALERHVGRLEDDLDQARGQIGTLTSERDEARAALGQIEVLRAQLEAERTRASAVELDRDRWHAEAQQDRAARALDADKAEAEANAARAELAAWKARPWWRRALG